MKNGAAPSARGHTITIHKMVCEVSPKYEPIASDLIADIVRLDATELPERGQKIILPLQGDARRGVVRLYRHGGVFGNLLGRRYFTPGRALKEFRLLARAQALPVPEPVIGGGRQEWLLNWRLFLVTIEIKETKEFDSYLKDGIEPLPAMISAVGAALRKLHDAGIAHRDLQVRNILLRERRLEKDYEAFIVDFDRAHRYNRLGELRRAAALLRFYRSLSKRLGCERADKLFHAVLREYAVSPTEYDKLARHSAGRSLLGKLMRLKWRMADLLYRSVKQ